MRKLRCIMAEDEPVARKIIREFIGQIDYLELVGEFENAMRAESFLKEHDADILFLDIEMPRLTGFDFLKACAVKPQVIITTAYPQYAIEGYALHVTDYLLKPIAFPRFLQAVQKAKEQIDLRNATLDSDTLFIKEGGRLVKVKLPEVLYFEGNGNYVSVVSGNKKLLAYMTLKSIEEQLPKGMFIKVHRSFLVNFSNIEKIEDGQLTVGGKNVPLSRNYADALNRAVSDKLLKR